MLIFEWNSIKAKSNLLKHGISFTEAQTVFMDEQALQFFDTEYSSEEDRFIMLGRSAHTRVLVVCRCERDKGNVIRVISACKATKKEHNFYMEQRG